MNSGNTIEIQLQNLFELRFEYILKNKNRFVAGFNYYQNEWKNWVFFHIIEIFAEEFCDIYWLIGIWIIFIELNRINHYFLMTDPDTYKRLHLQNRAKDDYLLQYCRLLCNGYWLACFRFTIDTRARLPMWWEFFTD